MVLLVSLDRSVYRGVVLEHRVLLVLRDLVDFQDHLASLEQMDLTAILEREVHQALQGVQDYLACLAQRVLLVKKESRAVLVSRGCLVFMAIPAREVLGVHQVCRE